MRTPETDSLCAEKRAGLVVLEHLFSRGLEWKSKRGYASREVGLMRGGVYLVC